MAETPRNVQIPGFVSPREAAIILNCSVDYIRRLRTLGHLKIRLRIHKEFGLLSESDVRAYKATYRPNKPSAGARLRSGGPVPFVE